MTNPFDTSLRLTGSVGSTAYAKQRIYTAPSSTLNYFDSNNELGINSGSKYLVSGFAMADSAVLGGDSKLALRLDVTYYQGSGSTDHVESYYVELRNIRTMNLKISRRYGIL